MPHTSLTLLRRTAVAVAVALGAVGLGVPGPGLRPAVAQAECDAQCWAILHYLTEQGLTSEEIEELGNSGIPPDPDTPEEFFQPPTVTTITLPPSPTTTAPAAAPTTTAPTTAPTTTAPTTAPTTTAPTTAPTTTAPTLWRPPTPAPTTALPAYSGECDPTTTWACDEIDAGIEAGYLPEGFNPHDDVDTQDLLLIIEEFGNENPDFDQQAALLALQNAGTQPDRGEMFNAIAAGLGIPYNPEEGGDVADELSDLGIVWGHDGDPSHNPPGDADPDSTLSNAALAALLDRIEDYTGPGDNKPSVSDTTGGGAPRPCAAGEHRHTPGGGCHPHPDPGCTASGTYSAISGSGHSTVVTGVCAPDRNDEVCTTGLALTNNDRSAFAAQLRWETLVGIEPQGEPGVHWPPHPDVPGGAEFLVVSQSPVWPVADPGARWETVNEDDGCLWVAAHVETHLSQMLPWHSGHRRVMGNAGTFGEYLRRWDNLIPAQQAQAIQHHRSGDQNVRCPLETATVSEDSYDQCRWELPESGVWSWQARACFEADAGHAIYRDCATLSQGIEWFLGIIDYTSGITVRADPGDTAGLRPRYPASVG